ncbi:acyltransferase domain-containing protein, partial [Streptomyces sp. NPDC006349]|uniref:acyltransferase domain-containing protein n=2 Tax=Streptomyces TaxID=1883 RepID=UPI0033B8B87F
DWSEGEVELLTEAREWPETGRPRRAGVSSFGLSGTNAHVIIEQAPEEETGPAVAGAGHTDLPAIPLVLSAKNEESLAGQALRLAARLEAAPETPVLDVAYSLVTSRAAFDRRTAVVVGAGRAEVLSGLRSVAEGRGEVVRAGKGGRSAFLFTGQGAQRLGMGRGLYEAFPVFAEAFDRVVSELGLPLADIVWGGDAGRLERTEFAQPALFAFEVALFRLLESWGVRPDFVAGHSVGEIAAAHVAGVFSLADAARLVVARGRLMQALPEGGAMVAVQATEDEVRPLLTGVVSIAAVNGPTSVVVSGESEAVEAVAGHFTSLGRKSSRLKVSHAFHSPLMEPMLDDFRAVAESLSYSVPVLPVVAVGEVTDPEYWVRHVRDAVRFKDGVERLVGEGVTRFVEVGPDGVLTGLAQGVLEDVESVHLIASQRRHRVEAETLVAAVAGFHCAGGGVDWEAFYAPSGARRVELPTYAFRKRRYWVESGLRAGGVVQAAPSAEPETPPSDGLLRKRLALLTEGERDRELLRLVREHAVGVLGHETIDEVEADRAFMELGFDSVAAGELRRRLSHAAGVDLPATLIFDYPTSRAVAEHLRVSLDTVSDSAADTVLGEIDRLDGVLGSLDPATDHARVAARLEALWRRWQDTHAAAEPVSEPAQDLDVASDDELFSLLDGELGSS